jgi:predicted alpha/beta superfamily hydrolase
VGIGELERWHNTESGELTRKMAERLNAYKENGLNVKFINFEGEGHVSVLMPLINKSLQFSLHNHV